MNEIECAAFAEEEFGHVVLGDSRRERACIELFGRLARAPSGRITCAYCPGAERERAYRFFGNPRFDHRGLLASMAEATRRRVSNEKYAFVMLDGSSITLPDRLGRKDFGRLGQHTYKAHGLKVISALVCDYRGIPAGLGWQEYWARHRRRTDGLRLGVDLQKRSVTQKETHYWLETIRQVCARIDSPLWFVIDREGDGKDMLETLAETGARFTVRSSARRHVFVKPEVWTSRQRAEKGVPLADVLVEAPYRGTYDVELRGTAKRAARVARMSVRARQVTLRMHDRVTDGVTGLTVNAVNVREKRSRRKCVPLSWTLLTNAPIDTYAQVMDVVRSYVLRWRIEEFHRAWKSGNCDVEASQLHKAANVAKLATMLASVAVRVERLKHQVRAEPDAPARGELTSDELQAISLLAREEIEAPPAPGGRKQTKLVVPDPETMTLGEAVWWLARLGGYGGRATSPQGTTTIARGLARIVDIARVLPAVRQKK